MGVELYNAIESMAGQGFSVETMKSFFRGVTGPLLEMSMLSGLQDALDAVSYADDKMTAVVANAALGYLGQAMPTLFGQIERIIGNNAEIKRLEEQTGKNLTPARSEKVLTVDGKKILLTADEYVTYATAKGQNDYTFREHLIGRENYAALDDKTKAKAM